MDLRDFTTVVFLTLVCPTWCDKVFKSIPVTVKAYENDSVLLPCYVQDSDAVVRVRWYKGDGLLGDSRDAHRLLPPRTRLHANYSLQIDALRAEDTARYTCEVIRPEPWGPIKQMHAIEVQYSPTIKTIPEDGFLEVRKGEYVDIGCDAAGTPAPVVTWKKNGESMALLEHRHRIKFKAEHRLLAGVFRCTADNGVGDPVTADIRVVIHDAPVVAAVRGCVHTAAGLRAALAARVEFAAPPARTAWLRDGRAVHADDRVLMMVHDNVYELIFRRVRVSDLGNYTFRAENALGMADVSFKLTESLREREKKAIGLPRLSTLLLAPLVNTKGANNSVLGGVGLHGVPNTASFKVDPVLNKATSTGFTLVWEVDSYSNIIDYNLWLRPYYGRLPADDGFATAAPAPRWSKIVVPGDTTDGPIHSASYTVRGLTPSTVYEAIVTSRNSFGWSKPSSVLHFATEPGTGNHAPVTHEYSDYTLVLEEPTEQAHNLTQALAAPASADRPAAILFFLVASFMLGIAS